MRINVAGRLIGANRSVDSCHENSGCDYDFGSFRVRVTPGRVADEQWELERRREGFVRRGIGSVAATSELSCQGRGREWEPQRRGRCRRIQ